MQSFLFEEIKRLKSGYVSLFVCDCYGSLYDIGFVFNFVFTISTCFKSLILAFKHIIRDNLYISQAMRLKHIIPTCFKSEWVKLLNSMSF